MVSSFVIGHWASSGVVGSSHASPPTNLIEVSNTKIGEELPVSFYHELVRWFSKDGDTVMEVGCGSEVGKYSLFVYNTWIGSRETKFKHLKRRSGPF